MALYMTAYDDIHGHKWRHTYGAIALNFGESWLKEGGLLHSSSYFQFFISLPLTTLRAYCKKNLVMARVMLVGLTHPLAVTVARLV